jgi:hypothetical protein
MVNSSALLIKTTNGNAVQNPLIGVANKAMLDLTKYAGELGLTPASRAKLLGREDADSAAPARPLGKKEQALKDAINAAQGTDWGDDLAPVDYRFN